MQSDSSYSGRNITDKEVRDITRVEELSYEIKIGDVMSKKPIFVTPDMQMSEVMQLFGDSHISGAPVVADGKLLGIVSIADLISALYRGALQATVYGYMTRDVYSVTVHDPVVKALQMFSKTAVGRLPVLDEHGDLVGVITKGDVTRGVLGALRRAIQEEEVRRYRASHLFADIISDRTSLILRYNIAPRDFSNGGKASSYIKRALLRLGANPQLARRCGIAIYEAEMNLVIHATKGGIVRVQIEPNEIYLKTLDDGPGIENIELALKPGYSTAPEEIREMGFGAGMGLENIRRCVDEMSLESTPGKGTILRMRIYLPPEDSFRETGRFQQGEHLE